VVGPEDGEQIVYLLLNREDGRNDDYQAAFAPHQRQAQKEYLAGLSTFGRFLRFREDFRRQEGYHLECDFPVLGGRPRVRLALRDACEFLSKKDYLDNWQSEMHETFCFWGLSDWRRAVQAAGFAVHPDSRTFTNAWIVRHRLRGEDGIVPRGGRHPRAAAVSRDHHAADRGQAVNSVAKHRAVAAYLLLPSTR
jgi:hypothetical protein